jgi:hypothetical protein
MKIITIALGVVLLAVGAGLVGADTFRQIKGLEIASKVRGMEFTDEVHFAEVFKSDGSLAIASMGARKTGKWRVSGDELCLLEPGQEERCYGVWMAGRNIELRRDGIDITEEGILQKPQRRQ